MVNPWLPWLSFSRCNGGGCSRDNPKAINLIHALALPAVATTGDDEITARTVCFNWPPANSLYGCNSTLNPFFTVASSLDLCFPTCLTTPLITTTSCNSYSLMIIKLGKLNWWENRNSHPIGINLDWVVLSSSTVEVEEVESIWEPKFQKLKSEISLGAGDGWAGIALER